MYSLYSRGNPDSGGENMRWLDQNASIDPMRPHFEGGHTIRESPNGRAEVQRALAREEGVEPDALPTVHVEPKGAQA